MVYSTKYFEGWLDLTRGAETRSLVPYVINLDDSINSLFEEGTYLMTTSCWAKESIVWAELFPDKDWVGNTTDRLSSWSWRASEGETSNEAPEEVDTEVLSECIWQVRDILQWSEGVSTQPKDKKKCALLQVFFWAEDSMTLSFRSENGNTCSWKRTCLKT